MAKTPPLTADHVLATLGYAELIEFATDLGAPTRALADLPDDPSRAHWASEFVAQILNHASSVGLTAADWVTLVASERPTDVRPIAGLTAGLV